MRKENWPRILNFEIENAVQRPFVWGEHDCCLFAANVVEAITGMDYAVFFRNRYKTALGAARLIKEHGAEDVADLLGKMLDNEVPALSAQRGDVCLVVTDNGQSAGICVGPQVVAPGETGLVYIDLKDALKAWRIE